MLKGAWVRQGFIESSKLADPSEIIHQIKLDLEFHYYFFQNLLTAFKNRSMIFVTLLQSKGRALKKDAGMLKIPVKTGVVSQEDKASLFHLL